MGDSETQPLNGAILKSLKPTQRYLSGKTFLTKHPHRSVRYLHLLEIHGVRTRCNVTNYQGNLGTRLMNKDLGGGSPVFTYVY